MLKLLTLSNVVYNAPINILQDLKQIAGISYTNSFLGQGNGEQAVRKLSSALL